MERFPASSNFGLFAEAVHRAGDAIGSPVDGRTGNQHPRYVPLPYGRSWHSGSFTCTSRVAGVTCRSRAGHGFFVSRQNYRLF